MFSFFALDPKEKLIVSFIEGFFVIRYVAPNYSGKIDKKIYKLSDASFQFDSKQFCDYLEVTFKAIIFAFSISSDHTYMIIEITENDRIVDLSLDEDRFNVSINPENDFIENTFTLKQFQKIYKDIIAMIENVIAFNRALNNGEIE